MKSFTKLRTTCQLSPILNINKQSPFPSPIKFCQKTDFFRKCRKVPLCPNHAAGKQSQKQIYLCASTALCLFGARPVPQRNEIDWGCTMKKGAAHLTSVLMWQTNPPVRQASLRSCLSRHSFSDGGSRTTRRVLCTPYFLTWQINFPVPRRNEVELGGTIKRVLCTPCSVASTTVNPRYPPLNKIPPCRQPRGLIYLCASTAHCLFGARFR